ncbi:RNase adapter RapZ [Histidinibacterium lentulum]|uniref:RNase adapter RapZ n=1 Tax=Histidinibacterium lentulum TaxID=2480588 RepID=A0A3N2R5C5_9RHOB|nr:RNase adapter RapZ [Histidinibacterium lentulum]ROU02689.1 RNase adapter RapZ [Histidinibacterium lentulum]
MTSVPETGEETRLVLVTGPSGAGRSTCIQALEDLGYEVIDNMPISLAPRVVEGPPLGRPLALGLDVRNRDFSVDALKELIEGLSGHAGLGVLLLYLDADEDTLVRRYAETRRRHPLSPTEAPLTGIRRERDLLQPIRARADVLIDTGPLSPHQLREEVGRWFATDASAGLVVSVTSFSYRRGLPRGLDMVFDTRFLKNPHWDAALRPLSGLDPCVVSHVHGDPRYGPFFDRVRDLVQSLLPAFRQEGKSHLSIGFGCTGGQHRSVTLTEHLAAALAEAGERVSIRHRELERRADLAVPQDRQRGAPVP